MLQQCYKRQENRQSTELINTDLVVNNTVDREYIPRPPKPPLPPPPRPPRGEKPEKCFLNQQNTPIAVKMKRKA